MMMHTIQYTKETQTMITITEDKNAIEVHLEGTVSDVAHDIWAILEAYRANLGDKHTLEFIEGYLNYIEDKLKGAN
jgi:hypothetical protein